MTGSLTAIERLVSDAGIEYADIAYQTGLSLGYIYKVCNGTSGFAGLDSIRKIVEACGGELTFSAKRKGKTYNIGGK